MRARVLAIVLVVAVFLLVAPGLARGDGPDRPEPQVTYVVVTGDTLWSIAQQVARLAEQRFRLRLAQQRQRQKRQRQHQSDGGDNKLEGPIERLGHQPRSCRQRPCWNRVGLPGGCCLRGSRKRAGIGGDAGQP